MSKITTTSSETLSMCGRYPTLPRPNQPQCQRQQQRGGSGGGGGGGSGGSGGWRSASAGPRLPPAGRPLSKQTAPPARRIGYCAAPDHVTPRRNRITQRCRDLRYRGGSMGCERRAVGGGWRRAVCVWGGGGDGPARLHTETDGITYGPGCQMFDRKGWKVT